MTLQTNALNGVKAHFVIQTGTLHKSLLRRQQMKIRVYQRLLKQVQWHHASEERCAGLSWYNLSEWQFATFGFLFPKHSWWNQPGKIPTPNILIGRRHWGSLMDKRQSGLLGDQMITVLSANIEGVLCLPHFEWGNRSRQHLYSNFNYSQQGCFKPCGGHIQDFFGGPL